MIVEIQQTNGHCTTFDLSEDDVLIFLNTLQRDKLRSNKDVNVFMDSSREINTLLIKTLSEEYNIKIKIKIMNEYNIKIKIKIMNE